MIRCEDAMELNDDGNRIFEPYSAQHLLFTALVVASRVAVATTSSWRSRWKASRHKNCSFFCSLLLVEYLPVGREPASLRSKTDCPRTFLGNFFYSYRYVVRKACLPCLLCTCNMHNAIPHHRPMMRTIRDLLQGQNRFFQRMVCCLIINNCKR